MFFIYVKNLLGKNPRRHTSNKECSIFSTHINLTIPSSGSLDARRTSISINKSNKSKAFTHAMTLINPIISAYARKEKIAKIAPIGPIGFERYKQTFWKPVFLNLTCP